MNRILNMNIKKHTHYNIYSNKNYQVLNNSTRVIYWGNVYSRCTVVEYVTVTIGGMIIYHKRNRTFTKTLNERQQKPSDSLQQYYSNSTVVISHCCRSEVHEQCERRTTTKTYSSYVMSYSEYLYDSDQFIQLRSSVKHSIQV